MADTSRDDLKSTDNNQSNFSLNIKNQKKEEGCLLSWQKNIYNKLHWINNILKLVITVFILIFSKQSYANADISRSISNEFIDNFATGYFMEFYKCNSNENRIKFDIWQGTIKGCLKIKDNKTEVSLPQDGVNCEEGETAIEKIPSQKIYNFKGLTLCGETKGNYYDLLFSDSVVGEYEECPDGFKNCGYIDTIKNKLCLKNDSQCPISYIKIRDVNSPPPDNITKLKEIKSEKIKFYYSNDPYSDTSEIPYIQASFKIADTEICALPNLYHSNIDLFILDALNKNFSSDCILHDYSQTITTDSIRYHEINSINQFELYKENGIIDKILANNLTNYGFNIEKYKENELSLYVRTHFGFNKTCLNKRETKFNIKELSEIGAVSDKMKLWSNQVFGLGIVSLIITVTEFFNMFSCCNCKNMIPGDIIKSILNNIDSVYTFLYTVLYGLRYDDPYENNMECSDFVSNSNYNIMIEKIHTNGFEMKICSCFIIILFILNIFSFIIIIVERCCNDSCKKKCEKCCCSCCINCFKNNEDS